MVWHGGGMNGPRTRRKQPVFLLLLFLLILPNPRLDSQVEMHESYEKHTER